MLSVSCVNTENNLASHTDDKKKPQNNNGRKETKANQKPSTNHTLAAVGFCLLITLLGEGHRILISR